MATKSILKIVVIKDNNSAWNLIKAMNLAEKRHAKEVEIPQKVSDAKADEIQKLFVIKQ